MSEESSETKASVGGETFMISRRGTKEFVAPPETSNTCENASVARCRLFCMIPERVEVESRLESER
jgi:hypothetical protein